MVPHDFDDFRRQLCAALGAEPPAQARCDAVSTQAFSLTLDAVAFSFTPAGAAGTEVVAMVDFGPLPDAGHEAALLHLLHANFLAMDVRAPVFGVHPLQRRIVWYQVLPLGQIDVPALVPRLASLAASVRTWGAECATRAGPPHPSPSGSWA